MLAAASTILVEADKDVLVAGAVVAAACKGAAVACQPMFKVTPKAVFLPPWSTPLAYPLFFQEVSKATLQAAFPHTVLLRPL